MFVHHITFFIAILFSASFAYADENTNKFTPQLTDCAAFFGLLSQSNTERTAQFKSMAFVFSSYSTEVITAEKIDKEVSKSMTKISAIVKEAERTDNNEAVSNLVSSCMNTLEIAEKELRPKMSELSKSLTPKIFE